MRRSNEINEALRAYIERRIKLKEQGQANVLPNLRLLIWKLRHGKLRSAFSKNKSSNEVPEYDVDLFQQILAETKSIVARSGGELVFVYLPEYERFSEVTPSAPWSAARIKPEILDMVSESGIDVIDIEPAFRRESDPLELFPFKLQGHYNSKGYAVVADEITRYLETRGAGSGSPFIGSPSVEKP